MTFGRLHGVDFLPFLFVFKSNSTRLIRAQEKQGYKQPHLLSHLKYSPTTEFLVTGPAGAGNPFLQTSDSVRRYILLNLALPIGPFNRQSDRP